MAVAGRAPKVTAVKKKPLIAALIKGRAGTGERIRIEGAVWAEGEKLNVGAGLRTKARLL